ncbi:MAG: hypothetical protein LBS09_02115 [Bacteroidales bacterium]|jgi:phosphoribosylformylglycinamidine synthase|nr:hypothetical protein [Bacteroidales bacterium]
MNPDNQPSFDGVEDVLIYAAGVTGRELTALEREIIESLYRRRKECAARKTVNTNGCLSQPETDDKAGIVELTEEYACTFKASPVGSNPAETFGKTYRELFVHGAHPLASMISMSIGETATTEQEDLRNAVNEVATPANIYGIPVVGGDVCFKDTSVFAADLLSVGIIDKNTQLHHVCKGEGNHVYLLGTPDEALDIFQCRTHYELLCDLYDELLPVAVQSVYGSGILGICAEMVADGENGILIMAETLSETQDDYAALLREAPGKFIVIIPENARNDMEQICRKWDKQWLRIGTVTFEQTLSVRHGDTVPVTLPAEALRWFNPPAAVAGTDVPMSETEQQKSVHLPQQDNCKEIAKSLLQAPNLQARQWFFNRFDSTVGINNLSTNFISDTSVVQIKGTRHGLAISFGSMAFSVEPYPESVKLLIAKTVCKTVCSGGIPLVVTGCLTCNANTLKKAAEIREHIAMACRQIGIASSDVTMQCLPDEHAPLIRLSLGNIAFLEDKHQQMTISFKGKGDMIYLIGKTDDQLNASEYIRFYHSLKDTQPPAIDMNKEVKLLQTIQQAVSRKLVKSAHSVSRGGLFTTLLESAMVRNFGFDITVDSEIRKNAFLFGEASSRVAVSVATAREADFIDFMIERNVPFMTLGHVTREEIRIDDDSYGFISDYKQKYTLLNN